MVKKKTKLSIPDFEMECSYCGNHPEDGHAIGCLSEAGLLGDKPAWTIPFEHDTIGIVNWNEQPPARPANPFKFGEGDYLHELHDYVRDTYNEHYSKGIQVTEFIMSHMNTPDFLRGNVLKYTARYGRKEGYNRKDILKAMHYLLLLMHYHDTMFKDKQGLQDK